MEDLVTSKHYFAGGSCRYMFCMNSDQVISDIDNAIQMAEDMISYLRGSVGKLAPQCINVLSSFPVPVNAFSISSEYADTQRAIKQGPDFVRNPMVLYKANPSLCGWLLEMWFFAKLQHNGFDFLELKGGDDDESHTQGHWMQSVIEIFDPKNKSELGCLKDF